MFEYALFTSRLLHNFLSFLLCLLSKSVFISDFKNSFKCLNSLSMNRLGKGKCMLKTGKIFMQWSIMLALLCMVQIQCGFCPLSNGNWTKSELNRRTILDRYSVRNEHIHLLQYYLSTEVVLDSGVQHLSNYEPHGLELMKSHGGDIIFRYRLPGKYIRHEEIREGFPLIGKRRMYFIVHFEEPHMNLKFREDDEGRFRLVTTTRNGSEYVNFEGTKYILKSGAGAYLEIDTRQLADSYGENRYIKGAPYKQERSGNKSVLIALAGLIVFVLYLGRTE